MMNISLVISAIEQIGASFRSGQSPQISDDLDVGMNLAQWSANIKKLDDLDAAVNIFIGSVLLEKYFEWELGSTTPTVKILNFIKHLDEKSYVRWGDWAGANRGNNPYTPYGYRKGFRTLAELTAHHSDIQSRK